MGGGPLAQIGATNKCPLDTLPWWAAAKFCPFQELTPIPSSLSSSMMIRLRPLSLLAFLSLTLAATQAAEPSPVGAALQSAVDKHIVAGAVAFVANKDHVLDLEAAGDSILEPRTPIKTDALFWIASMSKSFTGTALMMLVDEGKVQLDDPVEKYLPEFKGQMIAADKDHPQPYPPQHPIKVREIMDHTSGLVLASDKALKQTHSLKDDVAQYAAQPLRQEPGTKYEYNNCGINTGGRIIEVVSGIPYADFMQQRIFTPLGLKDTTFWPDEALGQRLACTARMNADKTGLEDVAFDKNLTPAAIQKFSEGVPVPHLLLVNFGLGALFDYAKHYAMPAGGIYSTASDVGKFCQMLLNGGQWEGKQYLSPQALQQMTSIQTGDVKVGGGDEGYGVGWSVQKKDGTVPAVGAFGHRGARKTMMWVDPKNQLVLVLMVQSMDMTGPQSKELYTSFLQSAIQSYGAKP